MDKPARRIRSERPRGESGHLPPNVEDGRLLLPAGWGQMDDGSPLPDVAALLRESRDRNREPDLDELLSRKRDEQASRGDQPE